MRSRTLEKINAAHIETEMHSFVSLSRRYEEKGANGPDGGGCGGENNRGNRKREGVGGGER